MEFRLLVLATNAFTYCDAAKISGNKRTRCGFKVISKSTEELKIFSVLVVAGDDGGSFLKQGIPETGLELTILPHPP